MGKNEGWGQGVVDNLKNGSWVYAAYSPDGKALAEDFTKCRACHAPLRKKILSTATMSFARAVEEADGRYSY